MWETYSRHQTDLRNSNDLTQQRGSKSCQLATTVFYACSWITKHDTTSSFNLVLLKDLEYKNANTHYLFRGPTGKSLGGVVGRSPTSPQLDSLPDSEPASPSLNRPQ